MFDSIINFFLKLFGLYISPEDEKAVQVALDKIASIMNVGKNEYIPFSVRDAIKEDIQKPLEVLKRIYIPKRNDYYEDVQYVLSSIDSVETVDTLIKESNEKFIEKEIEKTRALLDDIDGKALDRQQREVVVADEDRTLVAAGAGSGKTLTISGKVKYLCDVKGISPSDILLISFTKKSAQEITERINSKLGIGVSACTFHKLGLDIIARVNQSRPLVLDSLEDFVKGYFAKNLLHHTQRMTNVIQFFSYYLNIPMDFTKFNVLGDAYASQKTAEFESLKSKYNQALWVQRQTDTRLSEKTSLKQERMKSLEEVMLANFLFLHGVNYEYEKKYPHTSGIASKRGYYPDFYLPDYDIYIEHFGVTEDFRAPWLDFDAENKYLAGIQWKRSVHKKNKTVLLETYSYMVSRGTFFDELDKMLSQYGVRYNLPSFDDIYTTCYVNKEDRQIKEFIKLCCSFISLFKSKGYSVKDLGSLFLANPKNIASRPWLDKRYIYKRESLFKEIIAPVLKDYSDYLKSQDAVDFSDMINLATALVPRDSGVNHYKYIIIDEYQDVSKARFNLIKAIIEKTHAKLLCVGDDWQSIYRFAGSDVSLFTGFDKYLGEYRSQKIEKTYRNSQQLIDAAQSFILKNPKQMKKNLSSPKSLDTPIRFYYYANGLANTLRVILSEINREGHDGSIMFLGRTSHDEEILLESGLFYKVGADQLVFKDYPKLNVQFFTAHKSKGLEADSVIIVNFKNSLLGFPNKISDDPILEKVLDVPDEFLYAEERRLFYVALTRTRNRVYVLVQQDKPSEFLQEFKGHPSVQINDCLNSDEKPEPCTECKTGVLVARKSFKTGKKFFGCSNYPQCQYMKFFDGSSHWQQSSPKNNTTAPPPRKEPPSSNTPPPVPAAYRKERVGASHKETVPPNTPPKTTPPVDKAPPPSSGKRTAKCPKCGAPMVFRNGPYGLFLGCSNYPQCRGTRHLARK